MLKDKRLADFPESAKAQERVSVLELQVPASTTVNLTPGGTL